MLKNKLKTFIMLLIVLSSICGGMYYFLVVQPNGIFYRSPEEKEEEVKDVLDNRNGIYVYSEIPDEFLKVSSACTITKIDYYLAIINKKWYSYRGSCLGTYQISEGSVEDLDVKYNSERKEYSVTYEGNKYIKNPNILTIGPKEIFITSKQNVALDGYKLLAKETMFDGHYYIFDRYISGVGGVMVFGKEEASQPYSLTIMAAKEKNEEYMYKYTSHNLDDFPQFIAFNKKIAIREKYNTGGKINYTLKLYEFSKGVVYDLNSVFPITVNGTQLNNNENYVYLDNNANRHYYVMLVGYNQNFCVEGSESDNVAYYEFKVEFDYNSYSFKTPTFVRAWYEKEGCDHVKKIMEE